MDAGRPTFGQRVSTVLWFLLGLGFLLGLPVLFAVSPWLIAVVALAAALLALIVAAAWRFGLDRHGATSYARRWITVGFALLFLLTILAASPIYYLSALVVSRPLVAPQATLSNGQKTIIFQGMAHIGSETFYKTVVYDLEHALADGYVAYYEGVMPDPAGDAWFSKTLASGGDLNENYKSISKVCGLTFQGAYFELLAQDKREHPERHVNADVSTLQLKQEYERLVASDRAFAAKIAKAAEDEKHDASNADVIGEFLHWSESDVRRHALAGIVCRGVIDLTLAPRADKPASDLDPLILDYRNRMLVERINNDPRQRIYVNYGLDHLSGILDLLKRSDPKWKVESVKWMRVMESPEDLHGRL